MRQAIRLRLDQRTALGWIAGLGAGSLVLALSAKTMQDVWTNQQGGVLVALGGDRKRPVPGAWSCYRRVAGGDGRGRAGGRHRGQEAKGYLDHLLVRPVSRLSWLAGRVAVAAAVLVAAGRVIGLLPGSARAASARTCALPPCWLSVSTSSRPASSCSGSACWSTGWRPVWPRPWPTAWSFLVEVLGASLGRWLLDISLLHHLARPPAAQVRWDSAALVALGLAAAAVGAAAFARRDLQGA